jgi:hypothetical protein
VGTPTKDHAGCCDGYARAMRRPGPFPAVVTLVMAPLLALTGCARSADEPGRDPGTTTSAAPSPAPSTDGAPTTAPAPSTSSPAPVTTPPPVAVAPALNALAATPEGATHLTVTDFDALRARLGVPDLSSEDLMTDRLEFWRRVPTSTVLLTDGLLREDNSLFDLRYGFTQDDVDWEAHWAGERSGFVLGLRPDLDLAPVERAVADAVPVLAGAEVLRDLSAVRGGDVAGERAWLDDAGLVELAHVEAESLLVRRGCVPFLDALGVDATVEDLDPLLADHDVTGLLEVEAVALAFTGTRATVRLLYPAGVGEQEVLDDLGARVALAADWPVVESIGFPDGFAVDRAEVLGPDGRVGEVAYPVTNPTAAANLALADLVPLGVCSEPGDLAEPTGL